MTVKEFIEALGTMPEEAEVFGVTAPWFWGPVKPRLFNTTPLLPDSKSTVMVEVVLDRGVEDDIPHIKVLSKNRTRTK